MKSINLNILKRSVSQQTKCLTKKLQKILSNNQLLNIDLSKLDFNSHYHIFTYSKEKQTLELIAMRNRLTSLLESESIVADKRRQVYKFT